MSERGLKRSEKKINCLQDGVVQKKCLQGWIKSKKFAKEKIFVIPDLQENNSPSLSVFIVPGLIDLTARTTEVMHAIELDYP